MVYLIKLFGNIIIKLNNIVLIIISPNFQNFPKKISKRKKNKIFKKKHFSKKFEKIKTKNQNKTVEKSETKKMERVTSLKPVINKALEKNERPKWDHQPTFNSKRTQN